MKFPLPLSKDKVVVNYRKTLIDYDLKNVFQVFSNKKIWAGAENFNIPYARLSLRIYEIIATYFKDIVLDS